MELARMGTVAVKAPVAVVMVVLLLLGAAMDQHHVEGQKIEECILRCGNRVIACGLECQIRGGGSIVTCITNCGLTNIDCLGSCIKLPSPPPPPLKLQQYLRSDSKHSNCN